MILNLKDTENTFDRPNYIFHKFFNSPVLCVQDETGKHRVYKTKDKEYVSITTMLSKTMSEEKKQVLEKWKNRIGQVKAEKTRIDAADRGTNLHNLVEKFLKNEDFDINFNQSSKEIKFLFKQVYPFIKKINNIRLIEAPLYSDKLQLAGKVDLIAEYDGELAIIDLKTSTKVKEEYMIVDYYLQTCAYSIMYADHFKENIKKNVIIMAVENSSNADIFITNPIKHIQTLIQRKNQYYSEN